MKALALSLATSAVVAGPASGMVHDGGSVVTPTFAPITNVAQQYGGTAELPAAQQGEISYLSWGKVLVDTEGQGGVTPTNLARSYMPQDGVTPANLARAYEPQIQGVSNPDGYQPQLRGDEQLVIRDRPDGFQPQTKHVDVVSAAGSSSFDSGDLALGFGLGLILATAAAIALAMVRDRERMAHS